MFVGLFFFSWMCLGWLGIVGGSLCFEFVLFFVVLFYVVDCG